MAKNMDMTVNRIPSPTWNWLKMNQVSVNEVPVGTEGSLNVQLPEKVGTYEVVSPFMRGVKTGLGSDVDRLVESAGVRIHRITVPHDYRGDAPIRVEAHYKNDEASVNAIEVHAAENSNSTIIIYAHADEEACGSAVIQLKYQIENNAVLRVVTVQTNGPKYQMFLDLGGVCEDSARFELTQVILGGHSYYGNYTALQGTKSTMGSDIAYLVGGDETLDMNYVAFHTGTRTDARMDVNGVLEGHSKKTFRGTIDFQRGAKDATGNEMESVLLMDDDVENKTIPVILCKEEDVEGNHGASIGRLDENLMFYLQSRGLTLDEIYRMMSRAKIETVNNRIDDEETRKIVLDYLDKHNFHREK